MAMTTQELTEIRERCDKATPGPWGNDIFAVTASHSKELVATTSIIRISDATFIAHARADIPRLLDEVERLQKENARLRGGLEAIAGEAAIILGGSVMLKPRWLRDFAKMILSGKFQAKCPD